MTATGSGEGQRVDRIEAAQPQRRDDGTHERGIGFANVQLGQKCFDTVGLAQPHERMQRVCQRRRSAYVRSEQALVKP